MDAHGYHFVGFSGKTSPEYFPSLIGCTRGTTHGNSADAYFDRIDVADRMVTKIIKSKWYVYDNGTAEASDPILQVQSPTGSYYIPLSELYEIAAFHHDDDTIEKIEALSPGRG